MARVPHAVERDPLHLRGLNDLAELPLSKIVRLEGQADHVLAVGQVAVFLREDQPEIVIRRPVRHLQFGLRPLVLPQQLERFRRQCHVT